MADVDSTQPTQNAAEEAQVNINEEEESKVHPIFYTMRPQLTLL